MRRILQNTLRALSFLMIFSMGTLSGNASTVQAPMDEPQDTSMAINNPDAYAWKLFVALNWPADIANKTADKSKQFGDEGPVVWETWRNANNNAVDTVFPVDGSDPGPWLQNQPPIIRSFADIDLIPLQEIERSLSLGIALPAFDSQFSPISLNETRLSKATYEFVRENELYNLDGQEKLVIDGVKTINFPLDAKEIKAQWRKIQPSDKPRFHWVEFQSSSDALPSLYGLTSLHITTKDLPNWYWATFEHMDNKPSAANGGWSDAYGWETTSRDRFACKTVPFDCEKAPEGIGLQGTKWENYRLRGSQIDFIDSRGHPTLLANSQPEADFQATSSCITCHARAAIGLPRRAPTVANRLSIFDVGGGFVGPPKPAWFTSSDGGTYTQLDFVWSLFRARPKTAP